MDERLYDRTKRLLCLGKILRHVEVRNVGCSHRCCKCYHDEQLLALVARAGLNYTATVQEEAVRLWLSVLCLCFVAEGSFAVPVFWYWLSVSAVIFL